MSEVGFFMEDTSRTDDTKGMSRRAKVAIAAAGTAAMAVTVYLGLIAGDNRAADWFYDCGPAWLRVRHVADKLWSLDALRARKAERELAALRTDIEIRSLVAYTARKHRSWDAQAKKVSDILASIGAPAIAPLFRATSEAERRIIADAGRRAPGGKSRFLYEIDKYYANSRLMRLRAVTSVCREALSRMGSKAVEPFSQILSQSADTLDAQLAVGMIGSIEGPEATKALISCVSSGPPGAQWYGLYLLASRVDPCHSQIVMSSFSQVEMSGFQGR